MTVTPAMKAAMNNLAATMTPAAFSPRMNQPLVELAQNIYKPPSTLGDMATWAQEVNRSTAQFQPLVEFTESFSRQNEQMMKNIMGSVLPVMMNNSAQFKAQVPSIAASLAKVNVQVPNFNDLGIARLAEQYRNLAPRISFSMEPYMSAAKAAANIIEQYELNTSSWNIGHSLQRAAELADLYGVDNPAGYMELLEREVEEKRPADEEENEAFRQYLHQLGSIYLTVSHFLISDPKAHLAYFLLGLFFTQLSNIGWHPAISNSLGTVIGGGPAVVHMFRENAKKKADKEKTAD